MNNQKFNNIRLSVSEEPKPEPVKPKPIRTTPPREKKEDDDQKVSITYEEIGV